jgi:hypothetical protein
LQTLSGRANIVPSIDSLLAKRTSLQSQVDKVPETPASVDVLFNGNNLTVLCILCVHIVVMLTVIALMDTFCVRANSRVKVAQSVYSVPVNANSNVKVIWGVDRGTIEQVSKLFRSVQHIRTKDRRNHWSTGNQGVYVVSHYLLSTEDDAYVILAFESMSYIYDIAVDVRAGKAIEIFISNGNDWTSVLNNYVKPDTVYIANLDGKYKADKIKIYITGNQLSGNHTSLYP